MTADLQAIPIPRNSAFAFCLSNYIRKARDGLTGDEAAVEWLPTLATSEEFNGVSWTNLVIMSRRFWGWSMGDMWPAFFIFTKDSWSALRTVPACCPSTYHARSLAVLNADVLVQGSWSSQRSLPSLHIDNHPWPEISQGLVIKDV